MDKKDMVLLIEAEDELNDMDKVLEQLAGHGHANGEFVKLDNIFEVIYRNVSDFYYSEEGQEIFFYILMNRDWTAEQRADILMNGTIREITSGEGGFF